MGKVKQCLFEEDGTAYKRDTKLVVKPNLDVEEVNVDAVECDSCEEIIECEDDQYYSNGTEKDKTVCETCYCESRVVCSYVTPNCEYPGTISEYCSYLDDTFYGEKVCPAVEEHADSIKWHASDAWRGHYEGDTPKGYTNVITGWSSGGWGSGTDEVNDFHEMWEEDKERFAHIRMFVAIMPTSNVFAQGVDVFVHDDDLELFKMRVNHEDLFVCEECGVEWGDIPEGVNHDPNNEDRVVCGDCWNTMMHR